MTRAVEKNYQNHLRDYPKTRSWRFSWDIDDEFRKLYPQIRLVTYDDLHDARAAALSIY
jgi:hypothetical protein